MDTRREGVIPSAAAANDGDVLTADGQGSYGWSAPTGGGGSDDAVTVTIDLGNYYNYVVHHTGDPVDVSGVWNQMFSAIWDGKKVSVSIEFSDVAILTGYIDTDGALFTSLSHIKESGEYTKEAAIAEVKELFEVSAYKEMAKEYYSFIVYTEGSAIAYNSTIGLKLQIMPVDHYVDPVYYYLEKNEIGYAVLYEKVLSKGLSLVPWSNRSGGVTGYKWVENDDYWGTGFAETYEHLHKDVFDLINKRGKKFKFRGYSKTSTQEDGQFMHYLAEYRADDADFSITGITTEGTQRIILRIDSPYLYKNTSPNKYIENEDESEWAVYVGDPVPYTLAISFVLDSEYEGFVLGTDNGKVVGVQIPEVTAQDEGKVLMIVSGVPTWTTINQN